MLHGGYTWDGATIWHQYAIVDSYVATMHWATWYYSNHC